MTDKIVDLSKRKETRKREMEALRAHVDSMLQCNGILADAIEQMWDFADREEILKTLRSAIRILEPGED
jgi:hypothetical protein